IRRAADQLADLVDLGWAPVGGKPHDLVLVLVHREAEIGRERRIQHAERMWESDFAQECDRGAAVSAPLAMADRERGPLAHAVGGQDRRATRRSRQEGGGRVRLVVPGEEDLPARHAEVRRAPPPHRGSARRFRESSSQYWRVGESLRSRGIGVQPGRSRLSARLASHAKGGSRMKYWILRMSVLIRPASAAAARRYLFHK